jgi:hypothetical protein
VRDVHAAAAHGTQGSGAQLPHLDRIQRLFGRHDVRGVQAYVGGQAAAAAAAIGANPYATGNRVAFAAQPDLRTTAHEAAHVVQQRGGVQLNGGVGQVGDPYEQHADAVADLVVQGESSEALLDQYAGRGVDTTSSQHGPVQRHAFINGKQVKADDKHVAGNSQLAEFVADDSIRDYKSRKEMKNHAAGRTDYLGNWTDGTWLRFSEKGMNILGEDHTKISLLDVMPIIRSTSFISEALLSDDLTDSPNMQTVCDEQNAARFKKAGIEGASNKQQFGGESIYPKIGHGLTIMLPYFRGHLWMSGIASTGGDRYIGEIGQSTIRYAWAYGKDVRAKTENLSRSIADDDGPNKTEIQGKMRLVEVVTTFEGQLDPFIARLTPLGYLGDAFADPELKKENMKLIGPTAPLAMFASACIEALFFDLSNRTSETGKQKSKQKSAGKAKLPENQDKNKTPERQGKTRAPENRDEKERQEMFRRWRDLNLKNAVKDAASRGVRYVGMGLEHLEYLQKEGGLPAGSHAYDMVKVDIEEFRDKTRELRDRTKELEASAKNPDHPAKSCLEGLFGRRSVARPAASNEPVAGPSTKPK